MQNRLDIYISKKYKPFFDQLQVICDVNKEKYNSKIGEAIEYYIREINGNKKLIADSKDWSKIIEKSTKNELLEFGSMISKLNNKVMREICQR